MRRIIRRTFFIMIMIVGMSLLTGCGNFLKYYLRKSPEKAMEEYLEEKYDDDVICLDWYTGDGSFIWFWNQSGSNGEFSSKKYPGVKISCGAALEEGGWTYEFFDNYQNAVYMAGVQEIMEKTATKYFEGEYYVVTYATGGVDYETVDVLPFEEYITTYDAYSVCIFVFDMLDQDACNAMKKFVLDAEKQGFQSSFYLGRNIEFEKADFINLIQDEDFSPWYKGVEWLYKKVLPFTEGESEPEVFIKDEEIE